MPKPSDLAQKAADKKFIAKVQTLVDDTLAEMKVGDVDAEGNIIVAEGIVTDDGELITTDELAEDMEPDVAQWPMPAGHRQHVPDFH